MLNIFQKYFLEDISIIDEYFCEVKTVDSYAKYISKVFLDNIVMESFDFLMRKGQQETLEIILYKHELKGKYKFPKEIKRIQYPIKNLGEIIYNGFKFTLSINQNSLIFPKAPSIIFPTRYLYIYVDCCHNLPAKDTNNLSDPFVKISLNKIDKERYSNKTRVILKELNPIFKQTFRIPIYSLRDDEIYVEVYDYDKITECDIIGKLSFKISSLPYGIIQDKWYNLTNNGKIHLIMHLCDQNKPSFISAPFDPLYLNVKIIELPNNGNNGRGVTVHMKNDIFKILGEKKSIQMSKIKQFSNAIFSVPITNINDTYIIEQIGHSDKGGSYIQSSYEFETKNLQEGLIYRNNINGLRFWTQITCDQKDIPFNDKNYANYYEQTPDEYYTLQIEIIKMEGLKNSDINGLSDPYFIAEYGDQTYKSRTLDENLNPIFYDEFKFRIKNIETPLYIIIKDKDILKDDNLGYLNIDLTSIKFGKIFDGKYKLNPYGYLYMKWQITEPGQSRWSEKEFIPNILNINIGKYNKEKYEYEFWRIKLDYITKQTMITPYGVFNQTFSFIITDQTQIILEQYKINNENKAQLINTVPINFMDIKNGPFNITEELSGLIELVPYGTIPFNSQIFPLYFEPPKILSIAIFINKITFKNLYKNSYLEFYLKKRKICLGKSVIITDSMLHELNQYFIFELKSISTDILQIYLMESNSKIDHINIPVYELLDGNIKKNNYNSKKEKFSII